MEIIQKKSNTNFESLIKNIQNNKNLYNLVFDILINGQNIKYNEDNMTIQMGLTCGILNGDNNTVNIHNQIYEQRIYNYIGSVLETSTFIDKCNEDSRFLRKNVLDFETVLLKFQINYSGYVIKH